MAVEVRLRPSRRTYVSGESVDLRATIRNSSTRAIHVVTETAYIWRSGPDRITVLLAESPPANGLCYYGYIPPRTQRLGGGRTIVVPLPIGLPPREGAIDSATGYVWREQPVSGSVTIAVTVGYLEKAFEPKTTAPWAEFVEQQQTTQPATVRIRVAT
ncbi:MAG: hypothetical protein ABI853_09905 [Sphingomicrobium sp.]